MIIVLKTLEQAITCLSNKAVNVRTINLTEINPEKAEMGKMWHTFYQDYLYKLPTGSNIYGIYHNYESDASGALPH